MPCRTCLVSSTWVQSSLPLSQLHLGPHGPWSPSPHRLVISTWVHEDPDSFLLAIATQSCVHAVIVDHVTCDLGLLITCICVVDGLCSPSCPPDSYCHVRHMHTWPCVLALLLCTHLWVHQVGPVPSRWRPPSYLLVLLRYFPDCAMFLGVRTNGTAANDCHSLSCEAT